MMRKAGVFAHSLLLILKATDKCLKDFGGHLGGVVKVTAIQAQRGRRKRVNVFLDGSFAFSLEAEAVVEAALEVGQELSHAQIEELVRAGLFHRCFDAALRFLSYRPRSESEIRRRLNRRGFDDDTVEKVLVRLREQGLVDDVAFAQFWRDNRDSFSPRSKRLVVLELRQKGVDADIAIETTQGLDDEASAYQAAQKKARLLARSDYRSFCRRLGAYLRRRGFSYEVTNHTVERLWREQQV